MKGGAFLVPALFKTIVLPPLFTYLCLRFLPGSVVTSLCLYLSSFPVLFILRSHLSIWQSSRRARSLGARDIPRVSGRLPLNIDVLLDWAKSGSEDEVGRMMVLMGRKYGSTYNTRVLGEDQIISTDPAVLKHVLIDDFDNFVKGRKFKDRAEGFLGDGIFNSDGERWRFHRSLTRPFFHPTHISPNLFTPLITTFFASLPEWPVDFDIQARLGQLSLQTAILWLCGEDISSASRNTEDSEWSDAKENLGAALIEAQKIVGKRVKIGTIWPLFELGHDPLESPMRTIRSFFKPLIQRALDRRAHRSKEEGKTSDIGLHLIDRLVTATDDRKLIEDQLINILLASRDTTASLLTFCTYALGLYPEIAQRLKEEVDNVAEQEGEVTKDTIRDLRQCRSFINETLRLFPPVPLNIRRTLRPSLLPASSGGPPLYMPGNTSIILAFILMQRDRTIWGDNAEEFDIDRWANMGKEREAFMSWNVGPRMCLGQPFALTLAHTFLVHLFRHMNTLGPEGKLELALESQSPGTGVPEAWKGEAGVGRARSGRDRVWIVSDVVLAIKGGLWVRFVKD